MCIIAIKQPGQAAISEAVLQKCWNTNPDGAGIALCRHNQKPVIVRKGFMKFETFMDTVKRLDIKETDTAIYHFRIATSGGIRPELTHPFPITDKKDLLFKTSLECERAFIHNGVLGAGVGSMSDTQAYVLFTLSRYKDAVKDYDRIVKDTTGSRTVILEQSGRMIKTGKWEEDENGYLFSNASYKYPAFDDWLGGYYPGDIDENDIPASDSRYATVNTDALICPICLKGEAYEDGEAIKCKACKAGFQYLEDWDTYMNLENGNEYFFDGRYREDYLYFDYWTKRLWEGAKD